MTTMRVSVPPEIVKAAATRAAAEGTTVPKMVAELLKVYAAEQPKSRRKS